MPRGSWLLGAMAVGLLAGCGDDDDGTATQTTLLLESTNYVTQPTVASTTTSTTLVGQAGEQIYVVQTGDYPFKVADMFGVSWDEIKAYNGWTSDSQFPFPGGEV